MSNEVAPVEQVPEENKFMLVFEASGFVSEGPVTDQEESE